MSKGKEAEKAEKQGDSKTLFRVVKELSGNRRRGIPIKTKDGKTFNSYAEIKQRWAEHFAGVLNAPPPEMAYDTISDRLFNRELECSVQPFTVGEL